MSNCTKRREHVAKQCAPECEKYNCAICDGGLFTCEICLASECELTTDCPGHPVLALVRERVCAGELDFIGNEWVEK